MINKKSVRYSPAAQVRRPKRHRGPGRPKGARNKVTVEAKAAAGLIVDDPIYRENLLRRAQNGQLSPAMEVALWHYAKGKPKEEAVAPHDVVFRWDDSEEE